MKILFVNGPPIISHGLAQGLAEAGEEVKIIDVPGNFARRPDYFRQQLEAFRPHFIFVEGAAILKPARALFPALSELGLSMLFWAIDDPVEFKTFSLPMARRARHVFTPAAECVSMYRSRGISASYLHFACLPSFHRKVAPVKQFSHDLVFVGNNYHKYTPRLKGLEVVLKPLLGGNFNIKLYGNEWWTDPDRPFHADRRFYGGYLPYLQLPAVYSSAGIVLGIHSADTSSTMMSMRTFEALGCGAFYLTQWTPAIENMFENHKHLVWVKDPEETPEVVKFYLGREDLRKKIAASGQAEVYGNHTYRLRAAEMMAAIRRFGGS
ncbi:MAG: hypothetical protein VR68_07565 [Peptococcaceae bacterium BRH_c4a]|nr:MAG: hypothetical protein VR68_07565 [Peptococcaceae bacterium BRH_c4a]